MKESLLLLSGPLSSHSSFLPHRMERPIYGRHIHDDDNGSTGINTYRPLRMAGEKIWPSGAVGSRQRGGYTTFGHNKNRSRVHVVDFKRRWGGVRGVGKRTTFFSLLTATPPTASFFSPVALSRVPTQFSLYVNEERERERADALGHSILPFGEEEKRKSLAHHTYEGQHMLHWLPIFVDTSISIMLDVYILSGA